MHNLVSRFAGAGLDLRFAGAPFARGNSATSLFQLDIRRERAHDVRSEHFLAWLGAEQNLAAVQGVDPRERQLVLAVRENATEFEEAITPWMVRSATTASHGSLEWRKAIAARAGVSVDRIAPTARGGASVIRTTKATTRHLLVGRDERQLFMCQLPKACTSVRQAHDALRTPQARSRSRSALDRPVRQGEWFFVVPTALELEDLAKAMRGNSVFIRRKVGINAFIPRQGKPHIADEIVAPRADRVYVRGSIRHPDHKSIYFHQWRRVVKNLEVVEARSVLGGTWID